MLLAVKTGISISEWERRPLGDVVTALDILRKEAQ